MIINIKKVKKSQYICESKVPQFEKHMAKCSKAGYVNISGLVGHLYTVYPDHFFAHHNPFSICFKDSKYTWTHNSCISDIKSTFILRSFINHSFCELIAKVFFCFLSHSHLHPICSWYKCQVGSLKNHRNPKRVTVTRSIPSLWSNLFILDSSYQPLLV